MTNYILFSLGQPLHAFDFDKLPKDEAGRAHIVVRAAEDGERFTTLDEVERILSSDMTVISDGEKPIALAGVMGGSRFRGRRYNHDGVARGCNILDGTHFTYES